MSFKQIYPGVSRDKRNMYSSYFVHKGRYCQNTEVVISFFFFLYNRNRYFQINKSCK